MADRTTPQFRRYADTVMDDSTVLVPRLMAYFQAQHFPGRVDASLYGRDVERPADGWFHPSTHPGWSERSLYVYLTQPDLLMPRLWNYQGRMSANLGTMAHELIKAALIHDGSLLEPDGDVCGSCGLPRKARGRAPRCNEQGYSDPVLGSRGHVDGRLHPRLGLGVGGFDLKTSNDRAVERLANNDVEHFRKKWPYYYDQMQEYMRISGLRFFIVLFLSLGFPWEVKEVRIDYDEVRAFEIETKYRRVREAVAEGRVPADCCQFTPGSKDACPAEQFCRMRRSA